MTYKVIDLVQGSDPWLEYRKTKITATDAAVILGLNPWKTPLMLWEEKLGLRKPQVLNNEMREGSLLEEKARDFFNKKNLSNFQPVVLQSISHPFAIASLDGMDTDGSILEIKCGKASHKTAKNHQIASYYFAQLQHQIMVADVHYEQYFSYRSDEDNIFWPIKRDDIFIENMLVAEKEFYRCLMEFTPPDTIDRDYVSKDNDYEWCETVKSWKDCKRRLEIEEQLEVELRQNLIKMANDQSCKGAGVKVLKSVRKGNVDYSRIECLKNVNLDDYRKKPSMFYRISEDE